MSKILPMEEPSKNTFDSMKNTISAKDSSDSVKIEPPHVDIDDSKDAEKGIYLDDQLKKDASRRETEKQKKILEVWDKQCTSERTLREKFAKWLMILLVSEVCFVIILVLLIGFDFIKLSEYIVSACVIGVFGEIVALVGFIVRNLFPAKDETTSNVLEYLKNNSNL